MARFVLMLWGYERRPRRPTARCRKCGSRIRFERRSRSADVPAAPAADQRPENGYWSVGKALVRFDEERLGTPYLKPYFSFGYGLPDWLGPGST